MNASWLHSCAALAIGHAAGNSTRAGLTRLMLCVTLFRPTTSRLNELKRETSTNGWIKRTAMLATKFRLWLTESRVGNGLLFFALTILFSI